MTLYRERLWAAPWLFVATGLIIPATLLVFAPISFAAGVVIAIVLYAAFVVLLVGSSPTIEVTEEQLHAGRAHIALALLGEAVPFDGEQAVLERGQRLDARAWLLIKGWVKPVVRIPVLDPGDPTPYWLVSTRRPRELVRALNERSRTTAED